MSCLHSEQLYTVFIQRASEPHLIPTPLPLASLRQGLTAELSLLKTLNPPASAFTVLGSLV